MDINTIKQYKKAYSETCGLGCHSSKISKVLDCLKFIKNFNIIINKNVAIPSWGYIRQIQIIHAHSSIRIENR